MNGSYTFVHDRTTGRTYMGNYHPSNGSSAHERLANRAGVGISNAIGGYYTPSAGIVYRSESINNHNYGSCDWLQSNDTYACDPAMPGYNLSNLYYYQNGYGWNNAWE